VRLEFGAGELQGATLLLSARGRELSVEVQLPVGVPPAVWRQRISETLARQGLDVRELEVS